jgi:endoglucanase
LNNRYHQWLLELTNLPTAAGCEDRVIQWVGNYVKNKRNVRLSRDRYGNLTLKRSGGAGGAGGTGRPLYITAHMDHPAFVVREVVSDRCVHAEFRGGVGRDYFVGSPVKLFHEDDKPGRGVIRAFVNPAGQSSAMLGTDDSDKHVAVDFKRKVNAQVGDVLMWDVGQARIAGDRLRAPACDDLVGVAAALAAFDQLGRYRNVRVLLTRAEELGFIGAIAACKAKSIPKSARLLCLEASKSFAESPIGGGPIVRTGDYSTTFDPKLTYQVSRIAAKLAQQDESFKWQRKLMPGGTCEVTAFQSYGYTATCLCVPLGNYHNMNEQKKKIDAETISVADFDGLVRLLVEIGRKLDTPNAPGSSGGVQSMRDRLDRLFESRRHVL